MRGTFKALSIAASALMLAFALPTPASAAVPPRLVINQDFPDPDVLQVGSTYYAYSTNTGVGNVPAASAPSPDGPWTVRGNVLPQLGSWATGGLTWAPDVSRLTDGGYLLYYTARDTASGRQCVGAARASAPLGPFTPVGSGPLVCPAAEGGAIDASSFTDSDGTRYLLYKTDANALGQPPNIYLQRTAADGTTLQGSRTRILTNDQAGERGVIEAPVLVKQDGRYVLFYSAGPYDQDAYYVSYATSTAIGGPYTKAFRPLLTTDSLDGAVHGPGGQDIVRGANGQDRIVFHGRLPGPFARGMYVAELGWADGYPVVRGSRVRYEAERGRLNHCQIRTGAAGASQGAVAAYIDYADSWVEMDVFAAGAGNATVHVGYANGSSGPARQELSVNGAVATTVTYPVTGWDNWQQVGVDVTLRQGWNTLRLRHVDQYAELDYVEVG